MRIKSVVIFDVDGTLADIRHRRIFLDESPPNWRDFNAAMGDDVPNEPIAELYRTLWQADMYELIIVSGRSERFRMITEQWLAWNEIPFKRLLMRAADDQRADHHVKQDIHNQITSTEGKTIEFVVDDRQQVVDMWRRNGVTCLQCDIGDF